MLRAVFVLRFMFHRSLFFRKLKKFQLQPSLIKIRYDNWGGGDIDNTEWAVDLGGRENPLADIIHESVSRSITRL